MPNFNHQTVGFIGGGQMAYAVASGIVKGGLVDPSKIIVSNRTKERLEVFSKEGMQVSQDNMQVLSAGDIVFLAVKPQVFPTVVKEIQQKYGDEKRHFSSKIFVSVMAAVTLETMQKVFGKDSKIVRVIPNTPSLVGCGTMIMCPNESISGDEFESIKLLLSSCAKCFDCPEHLFGAASGLMGCSCAYFFVAIEALADGGVKHGLPRALALKLASNAAMGSGMLACQSDKHPGQLKDAVASPGGTTIRGLHALEKAGFRAALIDAVDTSTLYDNELSKK